MTSSPAISTAASPGTGGVHPTADIAPTATVGARVEIGSASRIADGAYLVAGTRIGQRVEVGPRVLFVAAGSSVDAAIRVEDDAFIGAGAIVGEGVVIGGRARVQPGAVVTRSVPPTAIVAGNPATIIGYVGAQAALGSTTSVPKTGAVNTKVKGVSIHRFPLINDLRGALTVGEFGPAAQQIPFTPQRYFMVYGVPNREIRGEHAHRACHQFLICVSGSCAVVADDGQQRTEVLLQGAHIGIYLPPMTWGIQYKYSSDAVLLVFASHHYDTDDYIRDYDEFLTLTREPLP